MTGRPCLRCLLSQAGEADLAQAIRERIAAMPPEERAPQALYEQRLTACRACPSLNAGTCTKCGCYVELRAARLASVCPHEEKRW